MDWRVPVGDRWQLQEAKNRLSEVVRKAREDGPQVITVHGTDAVVVVSTDQFRRLSKRKGTLTEFFRRSPLVGVDLDIARRADTGRPVDL
jgi:antitoxin Phd